MEVEVLQSIFCDEFTELTEEEGFAFKIKVVPFTANAKKNYVGAELVVKFGSVERGYPYRAIPEVLKVQPLVSQSLSTISSENAKYITERLVRNAKEFIGEAMIFSIVENLKDLLLDENYYAVEGQFAVFSDEILLLVFGYFSMATLLEVRKVNRMWNRLVTDYSVWNGLFEKQCSLLTKPPSSYSSYFENESLETWKDHVSKIKKVQRLIQIEDAAFYPNVFVVMRTCGLGSVNAHRTQANWIPQVNALYNSSKTRFLDYHQSYELYRKTPWFQKAIWQVNNCPYVVEILGCVCVHEELKDFTRRELGALCLGPYALYSCGHLSRWAKNFVQKEVLLEKILETGPTGDNFLSSRITHGCVFPVPMDGNFLSQSTYRNDFLSACNKALKKHCKRGNKLFLSRDLSLANIHTRQKEKLKVSVPVTLWLLSDHH